MSQTLPTSENVCLKDIENKQYCFKPEEIAKLQPKTKSGYAKQFIIFSIKPQTFLPCLIALAILGYVQYGDLDLAARFIGFSILVYLVFLLFVFTGIVTFWFAFDFYAAILAYTGVTSSILTLVVFYIVTGFGLIIHITLLALMISYSNKMYGHHRMLGEEYEEE